MCVCVIVVTWGIAGECVWRCRVEAAARIECMNIETSLNGPQLRDERDERGTEVYGVARRQWDTVATSHCRVSGAVHYV